MVQGTAAPGAFPDDPRRERAEVTEWCEREQDRVEAETNVVNPLYWEGAMHLAKELEAEGNTWVKRHRMRERMGNYCETVAGTTGREEFYEYATRLLNARHSGQYALTDEFETLMLWDKKAGLVKLCPDDAREDGQRVAHRYGPAIQMAVAGYDPRPGKDLEPIKPCECHYAVLTVPNCALGELEQTIADAIARFQSIFGVRGQFPEIKGSMLTVEAPMSAEGLWNVHLNVLLVVERQAKKKAAWDKWREAWKYDAHFHWLNACGGDLAPALLELCKYPLEAIASKSGRKSAGIPALNWSPWAFLEWWDAFYGKRRVRSYGLLYRLLPEARAIPGYEILGSFRLDRERLRLSWPVLDVERLARPVNSIQENNFSKRARDGPVPGAGVALG